jgi:hypothetical protein
MTKGKKKKGRKGWTQVQLDTLYECWKGADSNRERITLVEQKLPDIPPLKALNKMRSLAKTDIKWLRMSTRRKNQKEKEIKALKFENTKRKEERQRKKEEAEKKRQERLLRRAEREQQRSHRSTKEFVRSKLTVDDISFVVEDSEFRFCADVQHFVTDAMCVYRIFGAECVEVVGPPCDRCQKMDKYIPALEEVLKNGKKGRVNQTKRVGANKTGNKGCEGAAEKGTVCSAAGTKGKAESCARCATAGHS